MKVLAIEVKSTNYDATLTTEEMDTLIYVLRDALEWRAGRCPHGNWLRFIDHHDDAISMLKAATHAVRRSDLFTLIMSDLHKLEAFQS